MAIKEVDYFALPENTTVVKKGTPIFPRLDIEAEVEYIKAKMTKNENKKGRKAMQEAIEAQAEFDPEKTELKSTKKRSSLINLIKLNNGWL